MCGNAALCSTRLSVFLELTAPGDLRLLTDAGTVQARCPDQGDQAEIRLPDFDLTDGDCGIELAPGERWMAFATVGVPHLVIRVDDIEAVNLLGRGRALRYDGRLGSAGANVNFVGQPGGRASPGSSDLRARVKAKRWPAAPGPWPPVGAGRERRATCRSDPEQGG